MKKLATLLAAIMMLLPAVMFAQFDQTIGTGTENYHISPFCTSNNYSWTETIYPSSSFPGTVTINSISWYSNIAEALSCSSVKIYLGTKSADAFASASDWTPMSDLTLVYDGTNVNLGQTAGWETYTFNEPYYFEGNQNLVVVVAKTANTTNGNTRYRYSTVSNTCLFRQSTTAAATAQYSTSLAGTLSDYRANIKVNYNLDNSVSVSNINVAVTGRNANVTWDAPMDPDVTGYKVEYKLNTASTWTVATDNTSETSFLLTGLYFLNNYVVRVTPIGPADVAPRAKAFATTCISGSSEEVDVVIGTNTTTFTYLPSNSFYNYSLTEQIYTPEEVGAAGSITSVSFYNAGTTKTRSYDVYMTHTDKTSFLSETDWINAQPSELVYSSVVEMTANQWTTLEFDTPFEYDGTSNVVLIMVDRTGSYSSGMACRVTSTANVMSMYSYRDSGSYNPMNATNERGTLQSDRNNVIFHRIINTCDTTSGVRVENLAVSSNLRVATVTWDAPVGPEAAGLTGYNVEYKLADASDWIVVETNTPSTSALISGLYYEPVYEVRVSPVGVEEYSFATTQFQLECPNMVQSALPEDVLIGTSNFSSNYALPLNNYYNYSYTQQIYTAEELGLPGTITSISYNYDYSLSNSSKSDVKIYMAHTPRGSFSSASDFIPVTQLTLVYSGDMICSYGMNTFTLDVPFVYNGIDNLVVAVYDNSGSYNGSSYTFKCTQESENRSVRFYTDGSSINMNSPISVSNAVSNLRNVTSFRFEGREVCDTLTCHDISNLTAAGITDHRATIAWTRADAENNWDMIVSETPLTPSVNSTPTRTVVGNPSASLSALQPSTTYYVYVRANCGGGEVGPWSDVSFHTEQVPVTLPYECTFDDDDANNWILANGTYVNKWYMGSVAGASGNALYISQDNGATNTYNINESSTVWAYRDIIFPASEFGYRFSFDWRCMGEGEDDWYYDYVQMYLADVVDPIVDPDVYFVPSGIVTTTRSLAGKADFQTLTGIINGFNESVVKRVFFMWNNDGSIGNDPAAIIDNIRIEVINCPAPTDVVASHITDKTVELSWTVAESTNQWDVYYTTTNTLPSADVTPQVVATRQNPLTLTGLQENTTYYVYVRSNCGDGTSVWVPVSFMTRCSEIATIPYAEDFSSTALNAIPSCWIRHSASTGIQYPGVASDNNGSLRFYSPYENGGYAYCYATTQAIDMSAYSANSLELSFKTLATSSTYGYLQVGFMTDPDDMSTFTSVISTVPADYESAGTWYDHEVVVPTAYTEPVYLAFVSAASSTNIVYVDDVAIRAIPACSSVEDLTVSEVAQRSALVTWNNQEIVSVTYSLRYKEVASSTWNAPITGIADQSYRLSNLEVETAYEVEVTTECAEATAVTTQFTTLCLNGGSADGGLVERAVSVGEGTSSSNYSPSNSCYNYSYSQQVFTAEEIGTAGTINSLTFNCESAVSSLRNLTIYMVHTAQSSTNSGWLPLTDAQIVFSGYRTFSSGENTINLTTPFVYDGIQNLAIFVDDNTGSWSCSNYFYNTSCTGTASIAYSDTYNPDPATISYSSYSGNIYYVNYRSNIIFGIESTISSCDNTPGQCVVPSAYLDEEGEDFFKLGWTANDYGTTQGWDVYIATTNVEPTDATVATDQVIATEFKYDFTGLDANTTYYAYVRANCSATDHSEWAGPVVYSSAPACPAITLPYSENFNTVTAVPTTTTQGEMPECWEVVSNGTNDNYLPKVTNSSSYNPVCATTSNYLVMMASMSATGYAQSQMAILPVINNVSGVNFSCVVKMANPEYGKMSFGYYTADDQFVELKQVDSGDNTCDNEFTYSLCGKAIPAGARLAFRLVALTAPYAAVTVAAIDEITVAQGTGTIEDFDGNVYNVAQIGSNCWMTENLRSEHYSNGAAIEGSFDYNNNPSNASEFGKLYTWFGAANLNDGDNSAVANPCQGACPSGWHIPTVSDYAELIALSGDNAANLKSTASTAYWLGQFGGATPGLGFNAVPSGYYNGNFNNQLGEVYYWTTENVTVSLNKALCLLYYCPESFWKDIDHGYGLSIRCVRD